MSFIDVLIKSQGDNETSYRNFRQIHIVLHLAYKKDRCYKNVIFNLNYSYKTQHTLSCECMKNMPQK